jgi:leucyl aminopeptidase
MKIIFSSHRPTGNQVVALPLVEGELGAGRLQSLGSQAEAVSMAAQTAKFDGQVGSVIEIFAAADRIFLVGVGDQSSASLEKAGAALAAKVQTSAAALLLDLSNWAGDGSQAAALIFGIVLRSWRHDVYRTSWKPQQKPILDEIVIVAAPDNTQSEWSKLAPVANGVALTKELVTEPANILYPETFVDRCLKMEALGVEITILEPDAMARLGMGALLGVAQGSRRPARLLAMRWKGADVDPIALVGKGVTFDTGGISIKPAAGLENMKWDMGGAGAVAGAMLALAGRRAKAHVIGVCGLVENMPDGNAQRPGDVVTSMSGKTIEVINTDAEGRLVLCDAMTWVQKTHEIRTIIDIATLTGSIMASLGNQYAGLFSNDEDLADALLQAGKRSGDRAWRFPLDDAYDKQMDSSIADMKNLGTQYAGATTAAQFLQRFVGEGVKWAHLDIAGMAWATEPGATWDKGATGYGVRLLDEFVRHRFERDA